METREQYINLIGKRVCKISGKPFKSGNKVNTVVEVRQHSHMLNKFAFTFQEDDSLVECWRCTEVFE